MINNHNNTYTVFHKDLTLYNAQILGFYLQSKTLIDQHGYEKIFFLICSF